MLTTVLMCSNTQPTFHIHLNDLEVHLWRYLFNGHTASHVCLTQLQGIEVECIVHVCCICNKCSVCFVLAKLISLKHFSCDCGVQLPTLKLILIKIFIIMDVAVTCKKLLDGCLLLHFLIQFLISVTNRLKQQ